MYTKYVSILLYIYLHTDRLGSDSAVTDGRGEAVHVLGYMPYGETLLDLSHPPYETPYQFTGYEKDQETGLHYAGARYYDSWLSIFNSTDPMWYKYPSLSPYAYCVDNPVMLVDPDGMQIVCQNIYIWNIGAYILGSKPIVSSASRISRLGTEISNKLSTGGRTIDFRRINVGRQTETEQLNRL